MSIKCLLYLKIFFIYFLYNILLNYNGLMIVNINYNDYSGLIKILPFNNDICLSFPESKSPF